MNNNSKKLCCETFIGEIPCKDPYTSQPTDPYDLERWVF
jgi:hypothetical protein